jgi:hypothetical protein
MATELTPTATNDLKLIVEQITSGKPLDRDAAKKALDQISKDREELRKRVGTVDIVNSIIRDLRDS